MPATPLGKPVEIALDQQLCIDATSDDGDGNYLLHTMTLQGQPGRAFRFFQIRNGVATDTGNHAFGDDNSSYSIDSQPSGFDRITTHLSSMATFFDSTGHVLANQALQDSYDSPSFRNVVPAGGINELTQQRTAAEGTVMTLVRIDKAGQRQPDATVNLGGRFPLLMATAVSGNVLVLAGTGSSGPNDIRAEGRWFSAAGAPLTDWFLFEEHLYGRGLNAQLLFDGIGLRGDGDFEFVFPDGQARADKPAAWLQERSFTNFALVRRGMAYAAYGGPHCSGGLEVLARSGKSCGCAAVPDMGASFPGNNASIGRDGSLIVRTQPTQTQCRFQVYPQLLR